MNVDGAFYHASYESIADALNIVIPLLLEKGLTSTLVSFALQQLNQFARAAKRLIRPHVAKLVATLLQALSSLEPGQFTYLQQHSVSEL